MFNVDLSMRGHGGQAVVALRGELDLASTPGVASHLIAAVAACGPAIIVDLAGLESVSYSGLAVLVRMLKWTRGSGGDLSLAAPQPQVRQVLEATGLIEVFSVYASVEQVPTSPAPAQPSSRATPQRPCPVMAVRHGGRQPPAGTACHPTARPGRGTCRRRHLAHDTCSAATPVHRHRRR
jgi:anti-sigma B factor antagonist